MRALRTIAILALAASLMSCTLLRCRTSDGFCAMIKNSYQQKGPRP